MLFTSYWTKSYNSILSYLKQNANMKGGGRYAFLQGMRGLIFLCFRDISQNVAQFFYWFVFQSVQPDAASPTHVSLLLCNY